MQSANATNSAGDRKAIQQEVGQLLSEADRISQTSEFNGLKLLDGSFGSATFQVGANAGQTIQATTANFRTNNYGNNEVGTSAPTTAAGLQYTPGSFSIQGLQSATVAVSSGDTAQILATNINGASEKTGVTATAKTEESATFIAGGVYSLAVTSDNSTAANVAFTVGNPLNATTLAASVSAFNDVSASTGVTAKLNSTNNGLILTNAAGNNITLVNGSTDVAHTVEAAAIDGAGNVGTPFAIAGSGGTGTTMGYISLNSDKGFSIGGVTGTNAVPLAGAGSKLNSVSGIDVSSVKGASDALKVLDSALASVQQPARHVRRLAVAF